MALSVGELVLDRYVIEALVGVGGMGEVYRASHTKLGMPVAIKAITGDSSPELVKRFAREAMLLARVRHPNVVAILDVGDTQDGAPCMVMEFLEGEALDDRLERVGAMTWQEVRVVGMSVLKGLDAIHAAGIIHRDLKPANVLITRGNPEVVKLVDFGIAHPTSDESSKFTQTGAVVGTPAYMSPEQLVGASLDARSDIYAVSLMLYELVTGRLPFGDEPTAALKRLNSPIPAPQAPAGRPALPQGFARAILSGLAVDVDQRPPDARAFYALLRGGRSKGKRPRPPPERRMAPPPPPPPPSPGPAATQHRAHAAADPPHVQPPQHAHAAAAMHPGTRVAAVAPPGWQQGAAPAHPGQAPVHGPDTHADMALVQGGYPQPTYVQSPTHTAPVRVLVAARVPVSRLGSREEQRTLARLAVPGRAYHLGGGMWFAVVPGASEQDAAAAAQRIGCALQERYGDTCSVVWAYATSHFALTPASLSGAAPLPEEIANLLEHLL